MSTWPSLTNSTQVTPAPFLLCAQECSVPQLAHSAIIFPGDCWCIYSTCQDECRAYAFHS